MTMHMRAFLVIVAYIYTIYLQEYNEVQPKCILASICTANVPNRRRQLQKASDEKCTICESKSTTEYGHL